ncbi:hypothetical protein Tco_1354889 [Tanacetum coccineum]
MPGRPIKKRIKAIGEGGSSTRVSKVVEQTPKPKGMVCRPGDKQSVDTLKDVDVFHRGPVRGEGVGRSRGGARGSRGRGCAIGSRGGASGSRVGASVSRGVVSGSRGGSSVSGVASGSIGKGAGGSGSASCNNRQFRNFK